MAQPAQMHIYLVPGFFGFANLGDLKYFAHVAEFVSGRIKARDIEPRIHAVTTLPTACIRDRAARLQQVILETADDDDAPIHIVGHSSGGLDGRMFLSPGVDLGGDPEITERLAARVRSLVTVATPHRGTPLATFFLGVQGQRLLKLLSLITVYTIRRGRLPMGLALRVLEVVQRIQIGVTKEAGVLDQLFSQLLAEFTPDRQERLSSFFEDVSRDQALMTQLTLDGASLFNAAVRKRPSTRLASVVVQARPPHWKAMAELGLDAYAQTVYGLYRWLYKRVSADAERILGWLDPGLAAAVAPLFGPLMGSANDGIVPTASQPFGEVIHCAWADHLDVVGHFQDPRHEPPHYDWIPTGSSFSRAQFDALWSAATDFMLREE